MPKQNPFILVEDWNNWFEQDPTYIIARDASVRTYLRSQGRMLHFFDFLYMTFRSFFQNSLVVGIFIFIICGLTTSVVAETFAPQPLKPFTVLQQTLSLLLDRVENQSNTPEIFPSQTPELNIASSLSHSSIASQSSRTNSSSRISSLARSSSSQNLTVTQNIVLSEECGLIGVEMRCQILDTQGKILASYNRQSSHYLMKLGTKMQDGQYIVEIPYESHGSFPIHISQYIFATREVKYIGYFIYMNPVIPSEFNSEPYQLTPISADCDLYMINVGVDINNLKYDKAYTPECYQESINMNDTEKAALAQWLSNLKVKNYAFLDAYKKYTANVYGWSK